MEIIDINVSHIKDDPEAVALLAAYSEESRNKDLPSHDPDWAMYERMEQSGMMKLFGAFADGKIVGFIVVLMAPMPHYSTRIGTVESFYVHPDYRSFGTGKKILKVAEDYVRAQGSPVLYVTAPKGGRLDQAMNQFGYRPTNTIYCRRLND
jgi:GNAT superfamily N-acetyltransferase